MGEMIFVRGAEAGKVGSRGPGTGDANMSIACVMAFQQCTSAVSCSSVPGGVR